MSYFASLGAVIIVACTFIYSGSYVLQLLCQKAWRGVIGVSILALLAVVFPIYVLFFYKP